MLYHEACWFGKELSKFNPKILSPMLDIGSSTKEFRTRDQPWIDEHIFKPLRENGVEIYHLDQKHSDGVDIVGDLSDLIFIEKLSRIGIKSVFCSNVFEHVENISELATSINLILPKGGLIFVSCPYCYPYHPDPIDTMFRPDVIELRNLFPDAKFLRGEIVIDKTYFNQLDNSIMRLLKQVSKLLLPFYSKDEKVMMKNYLRYSFKNFKATCIIMEAN